jgi:uncharacterized protein with FMN-binding domain
MIRRILVMILVFAIISSNVYAADTQSNIKGHWAEQIMGKWIEKGLLKGDDQGNINPDQSITRVEFITFVNRMLGLVKESPLVTRYKDVSTGSWYYKEVAKAIENGYVTGINEYSMAPLRSISRQEAIIIISRIANLEDMTDEDLMKHVTDAGSISDWAVKKITASIKKGYFVGSEGKVNPLGELTRAEAVTILGRFDANERMLYYKGSYELGTVDSVVISGQDIILSNTSISGNLIIGKAVGNGKVTLNNVSVQGKLIMESSTANIIKDEKTFIASQEPEAKKVIQPENTIPGVPNSPDGTPTDSAATPTPTAAGISGGTSSGSNTVTQPTVATQIPTATATPTPKVTPTPTATVKGGDTYKDGIYEGVATGFQSGLHVTVTIENHKIKGIVLGQHNEDEPFITNAAKSVIPAIISSQSADVDVVSGATYSSNGIKKAVKYALNLAIDNGEGEGDHSLPNQLARYKEEGKDSKFYDVAVLADGCYVATGRIQQGRDINSSVVIKYSPAGGVLFSKIYENDNYSSVIETDNGILLAGYDYVNNNFCAVARMLNSSGDTVWEKTFDGTGNDMFGAHYYTRASYAVELPDKKLVIVGTTGSQDGDFKGNSGKNDGFILILNPDGSVFSTKMIGGSENDAIASVGLTRPIYEEDVEELVIAGTTKSMDGSFKDFGSSNSGNVFVMNIPLSKKEGVYAIDTESKEGWCKLIATEGDSWGVAGVVDSNSNVAVAYGQRANVAEDKKDHIWVTKFDHHGKEAWTKDFENGEHNYVVSAGVTNLDEIAVTMESYDESKDGTEFMHGWIGLISDSGKLVWHKAYESQKENLFFNSMPTADGKSLVVCGEDANAEGFMEATLFKFPVTYNETFGGTYEDKTYSGVARGLYAGLHVDVAINSGKITDIQLKENNEDEPYISKAKDGVIPKILTYQTTDVDVVSGATYSSRGIIKAVQYALGTLPVIPDPALNYSKKTVYEGVYAKDASIWFYDVEELDAGGYLVTGAVEKGNGESALIVKYNYDNTMAWEKKVTDARYVSMLETDDGILLSGYSQIDPDPTVLEDEKRYPDALYLDNNGNVIWQKTMTEEGALGQWWMWSNNVLELPDGNFVIGGMLVQPPKPDVDHDHYDAALFILNKADGQVIKTRIIRGDENDMISSVEWANRDKTDIIVTGITQSKDAIFEKGTGAELDESTSFVAKISIAALLDQAVEDKDIAIWIRLLDCDPWVAWQLGSVVDFQGNIYTAYTNRAESVGTDKEKYVSMTKFDASGTPIWTKEYTASDENWVSSIAIRGDDQIILTIESYVGSYEEGSIAKGWVGLISPTDGEVTWKKDYLSAYGSIHFNPAVAADGSYILVSGIEQNREGYYVGTVTKYDTP